METRPRASALRELSALETQLRDAGTLGALGTSVLSQEGGC